jgi:hypothetical protein
MPECFSPIVVQQTIPLADISPLERLILDHIFSFEIDGDAIRYFAECGLDEQPEINAVDVRLALAASQGFDSRAAPSIADELARIVDPDSVFVPDLAVDRWEMIIQDVIRRSATLTCVSAVTSWTSTKMERDAFGGMVTVITANEIFTRSTDDLLEELIGLAEYGPAGVEPGIGSHVLLRLDEEAVRIAAARIFETDPPPTISIDDVTDLDIRAGCEMVVSHSDFTARKQTETLIAALHALCIADERKHAMR